MLNKKADTIALLPPETLLKTGPVDHADWNFRPLLGRIMHMRYELVISLLPEHNPHRLLEVGYGSGIFIPELARHCDEIYGIDIHSKHEEITAILEKLRITARLFTGSVEDLPFADQYFDCVVAISTIEFIQDLSAACVQIRRVLKPDGCLVIVTPGHSPIVDAGLWILTRESAKNDYSDRREKLLPTVQRYFDIQARRSAPWFGMGLIRLYTAMRLVPRNELAGDVGKGTDPLP